MKDSGHFDKCNLWFLYLRKSRVLCLFIWFNLQIHYSISRGSGALLGPQKLLHFNYQICILPLFLVLFFQKFNLQLCGYITKRRYLFQYKRFWAFWQICSSKLVQFADKLVCKPVVGGLLGTPEAVAFLTSKHVPSYYPEHFLLKFQNNFT